MTQNLTKIPHFDAYNAICMQDFIWTSEMQFDSSVPEGDKNIKLHSSNLIKADH